ncbi:MAG: helicase-related protein [Gemmatimonadaceae bacterium]
MGKTFVAAAISRQFASTIVVAPAALLPMWRDALTQTETQADLTTFEALSRSDATSRIYELVIIDEAHHARNPSTRRYGRLAALTRDAKVLLLTATPIHNRRHDLDALLSLFLGGRAKSLTEDELSRCVIRREQAQLEGILSLPTILPTIHHSVPDDASVVQRLIELPSPVPVRDGGIAASLIVRGLVHLWASSEAALDEALRRRSAMAAALASSLESGLYPTARELETWTYHNGALQLGFPELLSATAENTATLLEAVQRHAAALSELLRTTPQGRSIDGRRVEILGEVRSLHPAVGIVAFSQYAETVSMLYRGLVQVGGVALLTAKGARVAGGELSREEALVRFAPTASCHAPPTRAERIDLLLTTDLLSEGVNLQDAQVVVHLDLPWTPARMQQRVGRVARLGSPHKEVSVYLIRPPASALKLLRAETILQEKWRVAMIAVGTTFDPPFPEAPPVAISPEPPTAGQPEETANVPHLIEALRSVFLRWRLRGAPVSPGEIWVSTVAGEELGFLAVVSVGDAIVMLASRPAVSTRLTDLLSMCGMCDGRELPTDEQQLEAAEREISEWFETFRASSSAGVSDSVSNGRKQLLNRIDAAIERAPPHLRSSASHTATHARCIATTTLGAAAEHELEGLARSALSDSDLVRAVAAIRPPPVDRSARSVSVAELEVHALLLVRIP